MGAGMSDDVADELRARLADSPFHTWVGLRVESASPGTVTVSLEAGEDHRNLQGLVHGGLLATLADTAMGLAVRTSVEPGRRHVTIGMQVQFLRAGRPGTIMATGRVIRAGQQVAHAEATLTDTAGRELARAQGTYSVSPIEPEA